jgi:hypothetical protein
MIRVRYRDSNELSPAAPSSSAPQPVPGATQTASSGLCVKVGPLGLCLTV